MAAPEITNVLAEMIVTDHAAGVEWYTALFGRPPDRRRWTASPRGN